MARPRTINQPSGATVWLVHQCERRAVFQPGSAFGQVSTRYEALAWGFVSLRPPATRCYVADPAAIDNDLPTIHGLTPEFFTNANPI